MYDDGDIDSGLKPHCLRPFKAFEVGDIVAVRDQNGNWAPGNIEAVYPADDDNNNRYLVDVQVENIVVRSVDSADLRRFDPEIKYSVGDAVTAKFRDDQWYPAFVERVNNDGTYAVKYTDGDRQTRVPADRLRRRT